jgi:hypothetical protein|tara:strand:- start:242 stop:481 length:240 start_codon:yes stop_codon:yes gene_type:complete
VAAFNACIGVIPNPTLLECSEKTEKSFQLILKRVNIVLGPSGEIVLIICSVPRFPILPELRKMNCCVCRKELASRKKTT